MIKIKTHVSIDSAHKLNLPYESKCNELHGHRWEIDIELTGEIDEKTGMLVDFTHIKNYFAKYDHVNLNAILPMKTTAENLAKCWAINIKNEFHLEKVKIIVAETPNNIVEYEVSS